MNFWMPPVINQEELERRARKRCGCRLCSNPLKHPCGTVLSIAIPVIRDILASIDRPEEPD